MKKILITLGIVILSLALITTCGKKDSPSADNGTGTSTGDGTGGGTGGGTGNGGGTGGTVDISKAVSVSESDGTFIGYLVSTDLFSGRIYLINSKGYFFSINLNTGSVAWQTDQNSVYYKKGSTPIAGGKEDFNNRHALSDCTDADVSPNGVLYVESRETYNTNNFVFSVNNALYQFDSANIVVAPYTGSVGSCWGSSTYVYKVTLMPLKSASTTLTGVKLNYSVPLKYSYNDTALQ